MKGRVGGYCDPRPGGAEREEGWRGAKASSVWVK